MSELAIRASHSERAQRPGRSRGAATVLLSFGMTEQKQQERRTQPKENTGEQHSETLTSALMLKDHGAPKWAP